jgi:hypothetical protein
MFDNLSDEKLRAAHDAAQLLYDNHRALGLDPAAIKLDTLSADIAAELENRGKLARPATPAADGTPAGGMILVEDDEQSAYCAARAALTARYGHLALEFTPASLSASGQHEASWAGGAVSAGTEHELLALVRAAMGDCGGEGHLWVTEGLSRDPADSDNVLISQRLECADCPEQERVITLCHPQPTPAEVRE